ncbi:MAG: Do family serine endopeptidase [Pseudomonadota bacterium]
MKIGCLSLGKAVVLFQGILIFAFIVPNAAAAPTYQIPPSFAPLVEMVKDPVVNISTTQVIKGHPLQPFIGPDSRLREFFGDDFFKRFFGDFPSGNIKTQALGSGFIISSDGLILTNNHVVEKATEIVAKLRNGEEYEAKIVGRDPPTDIALIKVDPRPGFPQAVRLGDSESARVGDWLMAVGNPFGLGNTVTVGILSAKGRIIGAGPYDDFLQTDAAINLGNSGGPLFNTSAEVIGISTAIVAQGQNIGFAIPINIAKELLGQLKRGRVIRGWLGVMIQDLTPELAKTLGLKEAKGALVTRVMENSPAQESGLTRGDVIVRFGGQRVDNAHTLSRLVAATQPKAAAGLQFIRDGKLKEIAATIGATPEKVEEELPTRTESSWGFTVQQLTPGLAQELGLEVSEGVIISNVESGSPAAQAGLQTGDLISEINRKPVRNIADCTRVMQQAGLSEDLLLLVTRSKGTLYVVVEAPGT